MDSLLWHIQDGFLEVIATSMHRSEKNFEGKECDWWMWKDLTLKSWLLTTVLASLHCCQALVVAHITCNRVAPGTSCSQIMWKGCKTTSWRSFRSTCWKDSTSTPWRINWWSFLAWIECNWGQLVCLSILKTGYRGKMDYCESSTKHSFPAIRLSCQICCDPSTTWTS